MNSNIKSNKYIPTWPHIFMALYGIGWAFTVNLGFKLYIGEVISLSCLPLMHWWKMIKKQPITLSVLGAYTLWILAIIVSDLYNETLLFKSIRNLASPASGMVGLIFVVCCFSRAPYAFLTFLISMGIAKAIFGEPAYADKFITLPTNFNSILINANFFKVRFEPFITPFCACAAAFLYAQGYKNVTAIWLGIVAIVYLVFEARSAGLVFLIVSVTLHFINQRFRLKASHLFFMAILGGPILYGAYILYIEYTLNNAFDGHNASQIDLLDNPYNPFSLLITGRSEWSIMPQAALERPIFGWGSWAIDPSNRFNYLRAEFLNASTYGMDNDLIGHQYIPAHSVIGSTWIWSGVIGLVAMLWLLKLIIKLLRSLVFVQSTLLPPVAIYAVMMLWHFIFSPPQSVRLFFPYALGALIVTTHQTMTQYKKRRIANFSSHSRKAIP